LFVPSEYHVASKISGHTNFRIGDNVNLTQQRSSDHKERTQSCNCVSHHGICSRHTANLMVITCTLV